MYTAFPRKLCFGQVFLIFGGRGLSHFGFAQCRLWQRHLPGLVCGVANGRVAGKGNGRLAAISPETFCHASSVRRSFRGNFGAEMTTNLRKERIYGRACWISGGKFIVMIQKQMKQAGMRWAEANLNPMLLNRFLQKQTGKFLPVCFYLANEQNRCADSVV